MIYNFDKTVYSWWLIIQCSRCMWLDKKFDCSIGVYWSLIKNLTVLLEYIDPFSLQRQDCLPKLPKCLSYNNCTVDNSHKSDGYSPGMFPLVHLLTLSMPDILAVHSGWWIVKYEIAYHMISSHDVIIPTKCACSSQFYYMSAVRILCGLKNNKTLGSFQVTIIIGQRPPPPSTL